MSLTFARDALCVYTDKLSGMRQTVASWNQLEEKAKAHGGGWVQGQGVLLRFCLPVSNEARVEVQSERTKHCTLYRSRNCTGLGSLCCLISTIAVAFLVLSLISISFRSPDFAA